MKILVTGGAGFIGGRVTHLLLAAGHDVTVFDNLSTGHQSDLPTGASFIDGDLRDKSALSAAIKGHEAVVHLAAQAVLPESIKDPQKAFDINVLGGQNLLEAMREHSVGKLIFSSSASVYGTPVRVPVKEDDPTIPINPYGATKLAFESLLQAYHASYGLDVVMLRYFNPYGPTERHHPETHAIPNFIEAIMGDQPVPLYWGGHQIRDFFYVDDIAQAHVAALASDGLHIYNVGSGTGVVVNDVLETISQIIGKPAIINDLGDRPGDPAKLLADTAKIQHELQWQPQVSLRTGLTLTIEARNRPRHPHS